MTDGQQPESELRDWLRMLKAQSGASFASIAQAIGEEERTVKRWMPEKPTAKVTVPRGDALLKLLDFFDVTLTPPAPRAVALSLMGELRDLRQAIVEGEAEDAARSLTSLDSRLEGLQAQAERTADLTAESLGRLQAAIEELSARLPPREQPGRGSAAR